MRLLAAFAALAALGGCSYSSQPEDFAGMCNHDPACMERMAYEDNQRRMQGLAAAARSMRPASCWRNGQMVTCY